MEKFQNPTTHSANIPTLSIMVTVTVSGDVMLSGLATDTITLKVSFSSSISSPSIVIGWQTTRLAGEMLRVRLDSVSKSPEPEANTENKPVLKLQKTICTSHVAGHARLQEY